MLHNHRWFQKHLIVMFISRMCNGGCNSSFCSAVSALQVIRQSTGFDFGWEDDPCSPKPWMHVGCDGNLVTSL